MGQEDTVTRGSTLLTIGDHVPAINLGTNEGIKAISTGYSHSCVLFVNSNIKCFGVNKSGQLGLHHTTWVGSSIGRMGENLPYVDIE